MRPGRRLLTCALLASEAAFPGRVPAQELELQGFGQVNYAARVTASDCAVGTACDFPLGEERLQLRLDGFSAEGTAGFSSKVDLYHDAVEARAGVDLRETYVDLTSDHFTLRAGRQIITWGVGDLLFVNDVFPKDWVAFFTGRPLEYLKIGSDALSAGIHPGFLDAEIVLVPFFQPDHYPTGERLILPDPFAAGVPRRVDSPHRSLENVEVSAKVSRYVSDWEIAAYASRTFYRVPAMQLQDSATPMEVRLFFPRLNTFGASATGSLSGGVLSLETAYYDSPEDRGGEEPDIPNSEFRSLIGYSHPLWPDATLGLQGFAEWMQDHDAYIAGLAPGYPGRDEIRTTVTLRFTQRLLYQTLTCNVFVFWGISERDAYLIPSVRYAFTDALWGEVGGNVFLAPDEHTMFGRFSRNDNVYLTLRYSF